MRVVSMGCVVNLGSIAVSFVVACGVDDARPPL